MRRILTAFCICALGCLPMKAQTWGEAVKNTNRYELDDMVIVTSFHKGIPTGRYFVTGDRKLKIMKAIGFIQEVYKPAYVGKDDGLTTIPFYAYARNLAPLDSADTWEVSPFYRQSTNAYGPVMDWNGEYRSDIGGIVISADRKDSTVVYGTVNRFGNEEVRDHFFRMDSVFSYPERYLATEPVQAEGTADRVQALRELLQNVYFYNKGFYHYGTEWPLENHGNAEIRWYKKGTCVRKGTVHSGKLMPVIQDYLISLCIDYTGRGVFTAHTIHADSISGKSYMQAADELVNVYESVIKGDCIEIIFPSLVKGKDIKGLLIQKQKVAARVYGLAEEREAGEPYLFYNNAKSTRKLERWLKKNSTQTYRLK